MPNTHHRTLFIKVAFISLLSIFLSDVSFFMLPESMLVHLVIALITFLITLFLLLLTFRPLDRLVKTINIFSQGNLNQRMDIRSKDELEDLSTSFNMMAQKLQDAIFKLEQDKDIISAHKNKLDLILSSVIDGIIAIDLGKNIVLVNRAIEEMTGLSKSELADKPIESLLHFYTDSGEIFPDTYCEVNFNKVLKLTAKDNKQIKVQVLTASITEGLQTNLGCILILHDLTKESELEQMKLDFVSMASHELKTPLTSIIGYLDVFVNENSGKVAKEEMALVERSLVSSKQLFTLVENILNVNKIERGQITINVEPTDLSAILQKGVEDLQNQAKLKNISLILTTSETPLPKVLADPIRISEVVTNLIANALNYTKAGGQVKIYTQLSSNLLTTTIEDNGVGIPQDAIPHLFNKFFRVSNTAQQVGKGTGLGLYISKSIIDKLNGKIWVESEFGQGSKFCFSLPLAPTKPAESIDSDQFVSQAIQQGALNY